MLVLGIDPGTAITGYGIVRYDGDTLEPVTYGVITTSTGSPLALRLRHLHRELQELIEGYHPTEASVEELFFARNARSALAVGHARGVILFALADAGLPVHEYTPLQVKQAITGYGRATKEQMQKMVRVLLDLETIPRPDDAADALAVAICHAHSSSVIARLVSGSQDRGR
ncbi:MAG TPA: crossover junction endodeoxyribonuclease RuvC [Anaerolineae bacterium]|nr:crossover junction endodeoxyribonuclease RuvC [Anaerolineae bacterium]